MNHPIRTAYLDATIDVADPAVLVSFGTSGHRGSPLTHSFNRPHLLAITQAVVDYRRQAGIDGPLFLGHDTHAVSLPAWETVLQVLVANGVDVRIAAGVRVTATPLVSQAILAYNADCADGLADGLIITLA